jgi:Beta-propeller repeat
MKTQIKILLFIFFIMLVSDISYSQVSVEWLKRYDGSAHKTDWAYGLKTDKFGNVFVTGLAKAIMLTIMILQLYYRE